MMPIFIATLFALDDAGGCRGSAEHRDAIVCATNPLLTRAARYHTRASPGSAGGAAPPPPPTPARVFFGGGGPAADPRLSHNCLSERDSRGSFPARSREPSDPRRGPVWRLPASGSRRAFRNAAPE